MAVDVLLGLQWGDEGKGKIVDVLSPDYDLIARFQGGPNAGHTLEFNGQKFVLNTIPSGIFNPKTMNLIGNGVVIDPIMLKRELDGLKARGFDPVADKKMVIARRAHLILPTHQLLDAASESRMGIGKIGSTLKGIGPTYMDKTGRNGIRIGDLELSDWKEKYRSLANKHEAMISFYNVDVQYDLAEMEAEFFAAVDKLKELQYKSELRRFNEFEEGKVKQYRMEANNAPLAKRALSRFKGIDKRLAQRIANAVKPGRVIQSKLYVELGDLWDKGDKKGFEKHLKKHEK